MTNTEREIFDFFCNFWCENIFEQSDTCETFIFLYFSQNEYEENVLRKRQSLGICFFFFNSANHFTEQNEPRQLNSSHIALDLRLLIKH